MGVGERDWGEIWGENGNLREKQGLNREIETGKEKRGLGDPKKKIKRGGIWGPKKRGFGTNPGSLWSDQPQPDQ